MKRAFVLVPLAAPLTALALFACAPAAAPATARATSTQAIINGEQCSEEEFPTAMAVLIDATINFDGFGTQDITTVMCTGTLIAPDVVLTAAHCTDPTGLTFGFGTVERADFYVSFQSDLSALAEAGETPALIPETAIPVREALKNPEFDINNLNGETVNGPGDFKDVGLLFLDTAIEGVEPELVLRASDAAALVVGAAVDIAGWGQQTATADPLQGPPPGTVGKKVCGASTINEVGEFEMQIGADATTTRKCHGDSGGPTYLIVDGQRRVIGITSHAYDAEDCNKGGVDTRVDVWLPWIEGEMLSRCEAGTRAFCDEPGLGEGAAAGVDVGAFVGDGRNFDRKRGCASAPAGAVSALALALLLRRRKTQ